MTELPTWETGLLEHFGITTSCCVSCIQDANLGYYICGVDLPDGSEVEVCCTHAGELQERIDALALDSVRHPPLQSAHTQPQPQRQ